MKDYTNIKTTDLINILNKYSFVERAEKCLYLSYQSLNYLTNFKRDKEKILPWIADSFLTLCILADSENTGSCNLFSDEGTNDTNYILNSIHHQHLPNVSYSIDNIDNIRNILINPQIAYQKNEDIILFRFSYYFHKLKNELLNITNGIGFMNYILMSYTISNLVDNDADEKTVYIVVNYLIKYFKNTILSLSITRDDLIKKTNNLYDDFDDLKKFSHSFKFISSYPFVILNNNWYLIGLHNFTNSITRGFLNRIIDNDKKVSDRLGRIIEEYIYMIASQNKHVTAIEDDSIRYKYKKNKLYKPDVSIVIDDTLIIIESKKNWSKLEASYNDSNALEKEKIKGMEACEKSLINYNNFINGYYQLCGKFYKDYNNCYLIISIENENYWETTKIINCLIEKYPKLKDFIKNNFFITTLYCLETYFLHNESLLDALKTKHHEFEQNSLPHFIGECKDKIKNYKEFIEYNNKEYDNFCDRLEEYMIKKEA